MKQCFPDIDSFFDLLTLADRKVLVLGLGGGSDIISAYIVAKLIRLRAKAKSIIYGNTKTRNNGTLEMITEHIGRLPKEQSQADPGGRILGTYRIDQTLPRGDEGCPWIFILSDEQADQILPGEIKAQRLRPHPRS